METVNYRWIRLTRKTSSIAEDIDGWVDGGMDGWMEGWIDGGMDGWMNGWRDGQIDDR